MTHQVLEDLAGRFIVLWGWRRLAAALVAGALSALALPPFDLFPVLFLTLPVFVWLIDGTVAARGDGRYAPVLAAAGVGWAFGFGYFLAGLWWIGSAFLVEAEIFGWMMPFAVMALPAGLAIFTAGGAAIARILWSSGPYRIFAFTFGLTLSELARGHLFTGFPWNTLGYALTGVPIFMQGAALIGLYGLTLLTCFIFASPAAFSSSGRGRLLVPGIALALLVGLGGYGAYRLSEAGDVIMTDTRLRIVQPSIDQSLKWLPEHSSSIFTSYLELSDSASSPEAMGIADIDLLIWPESALPFVFESEPEALPAIAALLPQGTALATGMQRMERDAGSQRGYRVYNSILVVDDRGEITASYDKVRLVPFGEFLPFQDWLEWAGLEQLTRVAGGFDAGTARSTMTTGGGLRFKPLICYEIIFSEFFGADDERPQFILNVTNDAWFGDSPGPRQHLRQAQLKAVEAGLPVIRAANTGISAVIDPYGHLVASLGVGVRGVLDSPLPQAIRTTPFQRWGHVILGGGLMLFGLVALRRHRH